MMVSRLTNRIVLLVTFLSTLVTCQYSSVPESSPCPQVFTYEVESSVPGRWYANIKYRTDVTLYGVWVNVILDKQADALASSFGEVTTSDNRDFKLENTRYTLSANSVFQARIYVTYTNLQTAPKLRSIRFNGREICATGFQGVTTQPSNRKNTNVYESNHERREIRENEQLPSSNANRNTYTNDYNNREANLEDRVGISSHRNDDSYNNDRRYDHTTTYNQTRSTPLSNNDRSNQGGRSYNTEYGSNNRNDYSGSSNRNDYNNRDVNTRSGNEYSSSSNSDVYSGSRNEYSSNTNRDTNSGTRNTNEYSGSSNRDVYSGSSTRDSTSGSINRNEYSSNTNRDVNSGTRNTNEYSGSSNRDVYSGSSNRDRSSGSSNRDVNSGSRNTNEYSGNNRNDYNERRNTNNDPTSTYGSSNTGGSNNRRYDVTTESRSRDRPQGIQYDSRDYDRGNPTRVIPLSPSIDSNRGRTVSTQTSHHGSGGNKDSAKDYSRQDNSRRSSTNHRDGSSNDYFEGDHNIPDEEKIFPTPVTHHNTDSYNSNNNHRRTERSTCGKVALRATPLIRSGELAIEGQWPWHAAVYQSQTVDSKYICGGSLVTMEYVLTAAHCVTRKASSRTVNPQTLTIYLGRYNLRKASDSVQIMLVRSITVHPEYNATSFYADLGLLKLKHEAVYTDSVRPVCLWKDTERDLSHVIGKEGSVVGWGFDESDNLQEELSVVRMPVVKQTTCLWSFKEFFTHFTSNHSYCAGYANGTSVCNGDSGGGMVFPLTDYPDRGGNNPTWHLRGVVSVSVARQNDSTCDPYHYVVFADVAQYLDWIHEKLA